MSDYRFRPVSGPPPEPARPWRKTDREIDADSLRWLLGAFGKAVALLLLVIGPVLLAAWIGDRLGWWTR